MSTPPPGSGGGVLSRTGSRSMQAMRRVIRRRRSDPPALLKTPRPSLTYRAISYLLVFPIYRLLFRGRTAGNQIGRAHV